MHYFKMLTPAERTALIQLANSLNITLETLVNEISGADPVPANAVQYLTESDVSSVVAL